ncbi:MAG: LysE family transporter [Desulfosarcinaceae bacterium]|nr:LysE family transporter [Desulfosarcinaceae bacterium]
MAIDVIPLVSFVLVTTFTPGPNNISSASMGMAYGYRRSLGYLVGIASGFFLVMLACAYLSSTLLSVMPFAERYLRWIGTAYILWLAMGTLKADYGFSGKGASATAFAKGFVLQLINPKVAVYGLTLYASFLATIAGQIGLLTLHAVLFAMTAFAATSTWALCGAVIRSHLKRVVFRRSVNAVLALLLVYTALSLSGLSAPF